jgi:DNA (cytosine-5)-methyltransferase 1
METVRLGCLWDGETKHQAGSVWDKNLIAPTIDTMQGGGREPMIIDDTYANRQPRVYEDYSPALRSEREGLKTIETISTKGKRIEVASTILAGYERTNMTGFNADNGVMEIKEEVINPLKGLTENGWHFEQNIYDTNGITRALKAGGGSGNIPKAITQYRIRKLTPKECWRLMDFTDEDFEKAAQVNSNTQLYKQSGNSIVRNVLVAIIGQMIPGKEEVYKNI